VDDVLLFANPIAGRGRGRAVAGHIARRLTDRGFRVRTIFEPPASVADDALRCTAPPRAVIAVGGDGTLRAVVERMIRLAGDDGAAAPPLLIVPLGTANLMGRHLGIHWTDDVEERVLDAVIAGRTVQLDAARANGRPFLLMTGIGIDAHIVHELDRLRAGPIDITSYALPAALALRAYDFAPLSVEMDGKRLFGPAPAVVFVGNVAEYGTGFPILPEARADDGLLDLCILPCASRQDLVRLFLLAAAGEHLHAEGVVYHKGRHIRIESAQPVPVQVDGEAFGHTPVVIDLLPFRLPFILPGSS
jgi:diacylglycerol kinase (ATP)